MQKSVIVSFQSSWILSKRDMEKLPVEAFSEYITQELPVEIIGTSLVECEFLVTAERTDRQICDAIEKILKEKLGLEEPQQVAQITIMPYEPPKKLKMESQQPSREESAVDFLEKMLAMDREKEPDDQRVLDEVIEQIHGLVGAEEFKALADECVKVAPGLRKQNMLEALTRRCYLLAINDGYGLSTYLQLFARLLQALKVMTFGSRMFVEEKLGSPNSRDSSRDPFSGVDSHLRRVRSDSGMVISVDISEWMTKTADKRFRDFLQRIDDCAGRYIFIFRVPFVEKNILAGIKKNIADVLPVQNISFVPMDFDELRSCAQACLETYGYTLEPEGWELFDTRITEEKSDGRFYGINTVRKVIREMIYLKELNSDREDTCIRTEDILKLAETYRKEEKTAMSTLENMIGMDPIQQRIREIVAQIQLALANENLGAPCIHMRFVGNPGTGKTTVARVLGKVLKEKGLLRNGSFFEYSGRDFCGQYVGETAPKTAAMCRDAYGSVLFIDEAYSLYREGRSTVDYGREAIDTLIAEMENHRRDLVVIMAGYPEEMEKLMQANPGLESRMPYVIEFPNYTRQQLSQILMSMVNRSFACADGFAEAVDHYFLCLSDEAVNAKEFSNARFVRNLFERTWCKAALRAELSKDAQIVLTKEDFQQASSEKEFANIMKKQSRTLGFV